MNLSYLKQSPSKACHVNFHPSLPQMAETNTPRPMDAAGECLLYDEFINCVDRGYL